MQLRSEQIWTSLYTALVHTVLLLCFIIYSCPLDTEGEGSPDFSMITSFSFVNSVSLSRNLTSCCACPPQAMPLNDSMFLRPQLLRMFLCFMVWTYNFLIQSCSLALRTFLCFKVWTCDIFTSKLFLGTLNFHRIVSQHLAHFWFLSFPTLRIFLKSSQVSILRVFSWHHVIFLYLAFLNTQNYFTFQRLWTLRIILHMSVFGHLELFHIYCLLALQSLYCDILILRHFTKVHFWDLAYFHII